jgi:hypothetical protein
LTAEIKTIFADKASLVCTQAAGQRDVSIIQKCYTEQTSAPLTTTLSKFAGTREPNGVVGHCALLKRYRWVDKKVLDSPQLTISNFVLGRWLYRRKRKLRLRRSNSGSAAIITKNGSKPTPDLVAVVHPN